MAQSQPVTYVYDEIGRLIGVINPAGDAATYSYDAVGNLLSIARTTAGTVSIIEFTPNSGPVGTTVTIYGTGFSATPSQNAVTFNSVAATVSSATTTNLVVSVPSGATTGTIGVTTPSGSATSSTAFTVSASTAPTITSFSPTIGVSGTAVTVTGTNFDTTAANDRVTLNISLAGISSATATSLGTIVPTLTGSGPITVSTPNGTATSTTDFFIPPSPYTASDVAVTHRTTIGGSQVVTINTANKIGLVTFAGTAGQRVSLHGTNASGFSQTYGCDLLVSVLKPDRSTLVGETCMETGGFIDATTLPTTATYTIVIDPAGTATGSITLALYNVSDVIGTIAAGGSAVTVTTTTPGQNGRLTFSGTSGQRISLRGSNASGFNITWACDLTVTIAKPDNSSLASTCMETGGFIDATNLPATGTYTVVVDPLGEATGSITLNLYSVTDGSGTLTAGSGQTVNVTTPGQNVTLTFSGTSGQRISLNGTSASGFNLTWACDLNVTVKNPDNSTLGSACMETGGFIDATNLPASGTYTVVVDPVGEATGSITLTLYTVSDGSGTLTAGSGQTVMATTPGQNVTLTFSGTSGQRISLHGTSVSGFNANWYCDLDVTIKKPDGSTLASTCMDTGGFIDATNLPSSGTYSVVLDPVGAVTGSLTLTLYSVTDISGTLTAGSGETVSVTTPGQNGTLTFSGTSGQRISLNGTSVSGFNANWYCDLDVTIKKPDNSTLASTCMDTGGFIDATTLPASGTYSVVLDPVGSVTGSLTLTLYSVPADASTTVTVGGGGGTLTTTTPGQNAQATFSGTASQQVTVHLTSNSMGSTTVTLLKPDGSQLTSQTSSAASFDLTTQTLPTTGTYTVGVDPGGTNTGSITVSVSSP